MTPFAPFIHVLSLILVSSLYSGFGSCYDEDAETNAMNPQAAIAKTITVDQSGHGQFTSVQQAINSIPQNNKQWVHVIIRPGTYNEKVLIPREKPFIVLHGESRRNTVIQFTDFGSPINSSVFQLYADNFVAKGITFKNTYNRVLKRPDGTKISWAPAATVQADKVKFYSCGFIGMQDTLTDALGRHYFEGCYIEGAIDFIWGDGQSIYERCIIRADTAPLGGIAGFITAQYRLNPKESSGFVFRFCYVSGTGPVYLGRALQPYSRVVFHKSYMTKAVVPEGWSSESYAGHEDTITYIEVACRGPGSNMSKRVKWLKKLSPKKLRQLIDVAKFLNQDHWMENQPLPPT